MGNQIVVIGSSNVDFVMKMARLPVRGETVTDASFVQTYGGKGANQAVGAAKAGGEVYFINCVGDDASGPLMIDNLRNAGVRVEYVVQESGIATGAALIMVDENGDNYISVAPGANYRLGPAHLDRAEQLISDAAVVLMQYEVLPGTLTYAIELAARHRRRIVLNLAPARSIANEWLPLLGVLVVNEVEAEFLVGFPVDSGEAVAAAADALLSLGPQAAVITLGRNGAYVAAGQARTPVPAYRVRAVDTTAAGDVFCGALSVALAEGRDLQMAVQFANAAAAISVTRLGAQPSAPSREEIDRLASAR